MSAYNLPNKPPPMKEMLTDMYECCDDLLENAGVSHNGVLVDLKKGSNAKFLQTNICLMMTLIGELIKSAEAGCGGCSEYIKELEDEKGSWQDGEFKLTKLLSEEREKNVDLLNEIEELKKDNKMLDVKQAKATKKADSQMKMKQQYEKQFDDISQQLNKLRQQLDKIDN
tara:strand:+ start:726 stop:1235 length:510 start_codon:yes stop_codon:yes gene_type:complete